MKEQDVIKELFSEKLGNYQAPVNPNIWANISAQMATTTVATTTGLSLVAKALIGLGVVAVTTVTILVVTNTSPTSDNEKQDVKAEISLVKDVNNEHLIKPEQVGEAEQNTLLQANITPTLSEIDVNEVVENDQTATNIIENDTEEANIILNERAVEGPVQGKIEGATIEEGNVSEEAINGTENTEEETPTKMIDEEDKKSTSTKIKLFNVFTPNGDMDNDFLYVETEKLTDFNVVVLNNKNQVVFQSNDQTFKWYGNSIDGTPVPAGNYVYFITAVDKNGNAVNEHSSLSILR